MSRITELLEAITKFTQEIGYRPVRLRIRKDIVEEIEKEISLVREKVEARMDRVNIIDFFDDEYFDGPTIRYFDGIPFIADDGFPHGIIRWQIEAVIDDDLVYHAKLDLPPISKETILIDLKPQ